jgi:hypothetical protein
MKTNAPVVRCVNKLCGAKIRIPVLGKRVIATERASGCLSLRNGGLTDSEQTQMKLRA